MQNSLADGFKCVKSTVQFKWRVCYGNKKLSWCWQQARRV